MCPPLAVLFANNSWQYFKINLSVFKKVHVYFSALSLSGRNDK